MECKSQQIPLLGSNNHAFKSGKNLHTRPAAHNSRSPDKHACKRRIKDRQFKFCLKRIPLPSKSVSVDPGIHDPEQFLTCLFYLPVSFLCNDNQPCTGPEDRNSLCSRFFYLLCNSLAGKQPAKRCTLPARNHNSAAL